MSTFTRRRITGWPIALVAWMTVSCMRVQDHVGPYPPGDDVPRAQLHLSDGTSIKVRAPLFRMDSIIGITETRPATRVAVSVKDVRRIEERRFSALDTAVLLAVGPVVLFVLFINGVGLKNY